MDSYEITRNMAPPCAAIALSSPQDGRDHHKVASHGASAPSDAAEAPIEMSEHMDIIPNLALS